MNDGLADAFRKESGNVNRTRFQALENSFLCLFVTASPSEISHQRSGRTVLWSFFLSALMGFPKFGMKLSVRFWFLLILFFLLLASFTIVLTFWNFESTFDLFSASVSFWANSSFSCTASCCVRFPAQNVSGLFRGSISCSIAAASPFLSFQMCSFRASTQLCVYWCVSAEICAHSVIFLSLAFAVFWRSICTSRAIAWRQGSLDQFLDFVCWHSQIGIWSKIVVFSNQKFVVENSCWCLLFSCPNNLSLYSLVPE